MQARVLLHPVEVSLGRAVHSTTSQSDASWSPNGSSAFGQSDQSSSRVWRVSLADYGPSLGVLVEIRLRPTCQARLLLKEAFPTFLFKHSKRGPFRCVLF